jgi:hypothetical protein
LGAQLETGTKGRINNMAKIPIVADITKDVSDIEHHRTEILQGEVCEKPATEADKRAAPGYKEDKGKMRYDLLPPYALNELAKVYTYGADKYTDNNWRKGMKWGRIFAALMRHLWKFWAGEAKDKESGILHLSHALWGVVTLLEYSENDKYYEFDDRIKLNKKAELKTNSKYYFQSTNSIWKGWWRCRPGEGYTRNIKKAHAHTVEEAETVIGIPWFTDIVWPEGLIYKGGK